MMKALKPLLILFFALTIAACGGGNSSSEDSAAEATITTDSGVTTTFNTNEATVDEVFEFFYDLGGDELTGTIRWGDNTETRVRGSGSARHIYRRDGTVSISIQIDGGESERVGNVQVIEVALEVEATPASPSNSGFMQTGSLSCDVSGELQLRSNSGIIFKITFTPSTPSLTQAVVEEDGIVVFNNRIGCPVLSTITSVLVAGTTILTFSQSRGSTTISFNAN